MAAAKPQQAQRVLAGLRRYQEAQRAPLPVPMPVVAQRLGASLRDYGGNGPPVLFVPSLINPPNVLDLDTGKSLLRWLGTAGHHPFLLDWGWDVEARSSLSVAHHVEEILTPLAREIGARPALVGYCLGGTMAVAASARGAARGVATIAAPWHFSRFPPEARVMLQGLWDTSSATVEALGLLPMEVLQSAFWSLDPERTLAKFERFAQMEETSPEAADFVTLEDWANDGPPIPGAAARELFLSLVQADATGSGSWRVAGAVVDPAALGCPLLNFVSTSDRIVPLASAITAGERIELASGHVGMVVGSRARETLWEPLSAWLSQLPPS